MEIWFSADLSGDTTNGTPVEEIERNATARGYFATEFEQRSCEADPDTGGEVPSTGSEGHLPHVAASAVPALRRPRRAFSDAEPTPATAASVGAGSLASAALSALPLTFGKEDLPMHPVPRLQRRKTLITCDTIQLAAVSFFHDHRRRTRSAILF